MNAKTYEEIAGELAEKLFGVDWFNQQEVKGLILSAIQSAVEPACRERDEAKRDEENCRQIITTYTDEIDGYQSELSALRKQNELKDEALNELKEYVRFSTLEIQSHRGRPDAQKDALFQSAYRLYVKHDVEGRNQSTINPSKGEKV